MRDAYSYDGDRHAFGAAIVQRPTAGPGQLADDERGADAAGKAPGRGNPGTSPVPA